VDVIPVISPKIALIPPIAMNIPEAGICHLAIFIRCSIGQSPFNER
jgi:hypothetical protein